MIGAWSMNVGGRAYGPFTSDRMRNFADEGRLVPNSLVSREGSEDWHEAHEEPEFFDFFPPKPVAAEPIPVDAPLHAESPTHSPIAPVLGEHKDLGRAHFAVVVDLKSRSAGNLEKAIESLGPNYRLLPNIWVLVHRSHGERGAQPFGAGAGQARLAICDRRHARQSRVVQFRSRG